MQQTIPIREIQIGDRFRKDMGDLQALADSIAENTLLQPIGIDQNKVLVFGERRLLACRDILKWKEIPARLVNVPSMLEAQHDENEVRKDFVVSERVAIGRAIEAELKKRHGSNQHRKKDNRDSNQEVENIPPPDVDGKSRKFAAERAGFGNETTYRQASHVVANGAPELMQLVDDGEVSISAATTVAHLPKPEQKKVVKEGPQAVKDKAREMRAKAPPIPADSKSPQQEADEDPERRWANLFYKIYVLMNSVRDVGGIEELSQSWSKDGRQKCAREIRRVRDTLNGYLQHLTGETE